jgi:hypothetical protein
MITGHGPKKFPPHVGKSVEKNIKKSMDKVAKLRQIRFLHLLIAL